MSDISNPETSNFEATQITDQPRCLTRRERRQLHWDMEFHMFGGAVASRGAGCPPPDGYGDLKPIHSVAGPTGSSIGYNMIIDHSGNRPTVRYEIVEGPVLPGAEQPT